jgi:A/G-specific adenine glycosylase
MLTRRELLKFRKRLLAWFRENQRDLPWRRTTDPYRIWLSEIMLQQTRVAAVIPYYERFLSRFPDIQTLAAAPEEEVLRFWSGLGYYSRARNLQRAAQAIVASHDGKFPRTEKEALALPGIGRYTAAAVLSIAYGGEHAVLDGNVARVLARIEAVRGDLRETQRWRALQKSADALLDPKFSSDWNQAMMELGAMVCTPRAPRCLFCPVAEFCRARKLGIVESLPAKQQKPATVVVNLAAAVFVDEHGQTLLLPPPAAKNGASADGELATLVSKMWHFPTIRFRKDPERELRAFLQKKRWLRNLAELKKKAGPSNPACARAHAGVGMTTLLEVGMTGLAESESLEKLKSDPLAKVRPKLEPLPKVRHGVTFHKIEIRPYCVAVPELPQIPGAKIASLAELSSLSSVAVSNLTRKVARAALAGAAATPVRTSVLSFRVAST